MYDTLTRNTRAAPPPAIPPAPPCRRHPPPAPAPADPPNSSVPAAKPSPSPNILRSGQRITLSMVPESPFSDSSQCGSALAEIGFFAAHIGTRKKLLVVNRLEVQAAESFINNGPLAL